MRFVAILLLILANFQPVFADNQSGLTLDLDEASLPEAIRLVAHFLHQNVMISPLVQGDATLHLQHANAKEALMLLLTSHGLAAWPEGNVMLIAPREELIKRKEEAQKWQVLSDESAPLITRLWEIKYAKAEDIARLLQDEHSSLISKRGRVSVDARTNIICIQEISTRLLDIERVIKRLDVPVKQILIEARLASVDDDFERELGVDFAVKQSAESNSGMVGKLATTVPGRYSLAVAKLADGSLLDIKLSALENAGRAELISRPSLFTSNQQTAFIEAGEEVPYQETSESGGTAIVFKKAVLGLKVTPQVLPGNWVLLQLQINQDRPSSKMVQGMPTISTRQIVTNVLVKAGQTIVLGGIYENNNENAEQRVPFLSKVPVLGELFKQRLTRQSKRELLIFVTPNIMTQEKI
jgi:type IV pilus assembly protein PilQ